MPLRMLAYSWQIFMASFDRMASMPACGTLEAFFSGCPHLVRALLLWSSPVEPTTLVLAKSRSEPSWGSRTASLALVWLSRHNLWKGDHVPVTGHVRTGTGYRNLWRPTCVWTAGGRMIPLSLCLRRFFQCYDIRPFILQPFLCDGFSNI